jgi:hypothetical protein
MPKKFCRNGCKKCSKGNCVKKYVRVINKPEIEKHDLNDVIEVEKIRKLLMPHPDLLAMFKLMIIVANKRINQESMAFYLEDDLEEEDLEEDLDLDLRLESDDEDEDE